jgi:hypothetical protein
MKIGHLSAGFAGLMLLAIAGSPATASFYSQASTHIYGAADWGEQAGVPLSHRADGSGSASSYWDWTTAAEVYADVQQGLLRAGAFQTLVVHTPSSAGSYYVNANASFHDTFTIDAGGSGLPVGTEVQIRFRSSVVGDVYRVATSGDAGTARFISTLWRSSTKLAELNYQANNLYPPNDFDVNEVVDQFVTVHIGDTLNLYASMVADLGDTGTRVPGSYEYWIDLTHTGLAQLGYAPGYDDIQIVSEAGAVILPEPMTLGLLALGGLVLLRRRG